MRGSNSMNVNIISVGKIKEKYLESAIKEYAKRISKFSKINFIELKDEPLNYKDSSALDLKVKQTEGKRIISSIPKGSFVIVLDLKGEEITSPQLAQKFTYINNYHSSSITFIIGGSLGLSDEVVKFSDYNLCFSKMTFPHQLMKVILLEQIYRAFKINNNETYHK